MIRDLKLGKIKWIDGISLKDNEIKEILNKYSIHELDLEACLEGNQKARIDNYDNYSFLILHFPKYNVRKKIYELNEFKIFLAKDYLITFKNFSGTHINNIFNQYGDLKINTRKKDIKVTSGFILYEITQAMLEKMFKVIKNITLDIKDIETKVFDGDDSISLVKEIMIKKRNIITLKHMFKPQLVVLKELEFIINDIYKGEMEVYFEDLEDKLSKIINEVYVIEEYIESIEDAFKSMVDIKTNFVIKILTVFSAFLLPLTLITSFYGMNLDLPFSQNINYVYFLLSFALFIMVIIYLYLRKTGRF